MAGLPSGGSAFKTKIMKPEFYITSCQLNTRYTDQDPDDEMELKQELLTVTVHFAGSGDTRKIGNNKLIASIMEKLKTIH